MRSSVARASAKGTRVASKSSVASSSSAESHLLTGLELDAVELSERRPAGGFEERVEGCGPVGVGAFAGEFAAGEERAEGAEVAEERAEGAEVAEERGQVGGVRWMGRETEEAVERELRFEHLLAAEDEGVELGAGDVFGRGIWSCGGEVR